MRADEQYSSIPKMALMNGERLGAATSIVDGHRRLTFADVAESMVLVARALIASGVEPGDRVGVWAPNSAWWIEAALGIHAAGAWVVPINTRFTGGELAYILDRADVSCVLAVEKFLGIEYAEKLQTTLDTIGRTLPAVTVPSPGAASSSAWDEFLSRADPVAPDVVIDRIDALRPDDICDIIFTSGTTGFPKGAMLRHGASLRGYAAYNRGPGLTVGDRHAIVVPFSHCFGYKAGWMLDLMVGATTYPLATLDPEELIALVERDAITHLDGPPTLFTTMLDHPVRARHNLASLRAAMVSATVVPADLILRLREEVGMNSAISGYGLTESHALVSVADPKDPPEVIASSVGHPLPDVDVQIVNPDGKPVGRGEQGEIWVRGYTLMSGYYDDPEETARVIVDGWLHTGDIGFLGQDGCLRITDRKKDVFVSGGFNVSPVEVEKTLLQFEGVAEVAVVGVPDERRGEVGVAFVVVEVDAEVTPNDVLRFASAHLANFKVPHRIVIVDALPRNATGKVVKPELRRTLEAEMSRNGR